MPSSHSTIHAYVLVLFIFYGFMINAPIGSNFIIYRTCYVLLGHNKTECAELGTKVHTNETDELEKLVQPVANLINVALTWPAQIIPAVLCLFVGPWSDKNGRKPMMVSSLLGFTVAGAIQLAISLVDNISPWWFIIPSLVSVCFGGFAPFLTLILCYITDVTSLEERGFKIGVFEGSLALGSLLGTVSSSYLFDLVGYPGIYAISTGCHLIALLYLLFFTPETVERTESIKYNVLSFEHIKEMFKTLVKTRANKLTTIILLTFAVMVLYVMSCNSDGTIIFFYLREKFHWDLEKYTLFRSVKDVVAVAGTISAIIVLHKWLKFGELTLMLKGLLFFFVGVLIQGLAVTDWQIYTSAAIRCTIGIVGPMYRSFVSKLISEDETGKVFSLGVTLETLSIVIGAPVYSLIYNATISTVPGAFNFVTAGLVLLQIILTVVIIVIKNRHLNGSGPYELVVNEEQ